MKVLHAIGLVLASALAGGTMGLSLGGLLANLEQTDRLERIEERLKEYEQDPAPIRGKVGADDVHAGETTPAVRFGR